MLCACGKMVHPCYENGGVCEDCIAEHSEKFHLPGCRAVYGGGSAREDDCRDNQTIIRSSKADCRGHRRARHRSRGKPSHVLCEHARR